MLKLNGLTLTYFSSHTGKLQMLKAVLFAVVPNYKLELNTIKISLSQPHEPHFKSAQEPHMATTLDSRDIKHFHHLSISTISSIHQYWIIDLFLFPF